MLPIADAQAQAASLGAEETDKQVQLSGLSTMVVDDNKDTCEVLRMILSNAGASVKVAHSVREGVQLLGEGVPDIILTDLAMPFESGLALIQHVRGSNGEISNLPIIVLSACAFASDRDAALTAGASMFIPKPFKPNEVLRSVRELTFSRAMNQ
jgi:CheY-like chemotaxis protein